ncbi:AraC family transcriptional regulator [Luteibacter sp.]|uniref:AraC family transcriptional regulator n=1 Tax=Luteibacter sp. TaxID=1886636 RepID=UPI002F42F7C4
MTPPVIHRESAWRVPVVANDCMDRVVASRWTSPPVEALRAVTPANAYVLAIYLRATRCILRIDGLVVHSGRLPTCCILVTSPLQEVSAEFFEPADVLHLSILDDFFFEHCSAEARGDAPVAGMYRDEAIEMMARAIIATHAAGCMAKCTETLGKPILARLLHLHASPNRMQTFARKVTIQGWRLQRATTYVDANLGRPITLADIASAAGLSPMHFAAQFRAATGHKPHEYLQLCRVERAKQLLDDKNRSLIDIALDVGFRTQAHFTTVFKRFAGHTPHSWRVRLPD